MSPDLFIERAGFAGAIVLVLLGVAAAWRASNGVKRVGGMLLSQFGALAGLAALKAPEAALIVVAIFAAAQLLIGAALLVRMQEAYGGIELPELDAADAEGEGEHSR